MKNQTLPWDRWIVIQDGLVPYTYTCGQEVVYRDTSKDDPSCLTVCQNYLAGASLCGEHDRICFIEDDDYYSPTWLHQMSHMLENDDLVGVAPSYYYHTINKAYMRHHNAQWASLACTAIRGEVLPLFSDICRRGDPFIDFLLWQEWKGTKLLTDNHGDGRPLQVGLKDGTGVGIGRYLSGPVDADGSVLSRWLGKDADLLLT